MKLLSLGLAIFCGVTTCHHAAFAAEAEAASIATYRITFNGNDVANDWVNVARTLLNAHLIELKSTTAKSGDGLCSAATRALEFDNKRLECSKEIQEFLISLNPEFAKYLPEGKPVYFPNLPPSVTRRTNSYDPNVAADLERYKRGTTSNSSFLLYQSAQNPRKGSIAWAIFQSYSTDISMPVSASNEHILASLVKFDSKLQEFKVAVERVDQPGSISTPYSLTLSDWWSACEASPAHNPEEAPPPYARYLGVSGNPECEAKCEERGTCPEILLFDRPVASNPALLRALRVPLPRPSGTPSNDRCPPLASWSETYHGTHLAGIMVSDDDPKLNEAAGLAPHAQLTAINSEQSGGLAILKEILNTRDIGASKLSIFTVATDFNEGTVPAAAAQEGDRRFLNSTTAGRIKNATDTLWVVAAGQADPAYGIGYGLRITDDTLRWPLNLGDLSNVIVVTACENCLDTKARVPDWANYSTTDMVSIAAPSGSEFGGIPGPGTAAQYTRMAGTSQSAAFVAGVAAEINACYPVMHPKKIKLRLELTAKPFTDINSSSKVGSGIIDPNAALKNPSFSLIKIKDQQRDEFALVTNVKWCRPYVESKSLDGDAKAEIFYTRDIQRLVRTAIPNTDLYGFRTAKLSSDQGSIIWKKYLLAIDDDSPLVSVQYQGKDQWHNYRAQDLQDIIISLGMAPAKGDCK